MMSFHLHADVHGHQASSEYDETSRDAYLSRILLLYGQNGNFQQNFRGSKDLVISVGPATPTSTWIPCTVTLGSDMCIEEKERAMS